MNTRPALLPVDKLTPENAERLFTRLLETEAHIEHASLYGLPGLQAVYDGGELMGRALGIWVSEAATVAIATTAIV